MKWKKLGKIFDPTQYKLPNNCSAFAQSPQALVFDKFVRIYFSTRAIDASGKYLSHIAFVDMEKNLQKHILKQKMIQQLSQNIRKLLEQEIYGIKLLIFKKKPECLI